VTLVVVGGCVNDAGGNVLPLCTSVRNVYDSIPTRIAHNNQYISKSSGSKVKLFTRYIII
jgi:hypothetical protein